MSCRPILKAFGAVIFAGVFALSATADSPIPEDKRVALYHYDVREDLSIYFSNSDIVIEDIRNALRRRQSSITVSYTSQSDNMADIDKLIGELMECALSETDKPDEGDYLRYQMGGYDLDYSYEKDSEGYFYTVVIRPAYYSDAEQEKEVSQAIDEAIQSFAFDETSTDYEKVRAVYDFVYANVDYDIIHKKNSGYHLKSTAYGALIYKHALCQGFSVLMYRMLRECGIDCRIVTGTAAIDGEEEFHAWNIVKVDGRFYDLDASWCRQLETEDYFLKCDAQLEDHFKDEEFLSEEFLEKYPMSEESYSCGSGR